MKNSMLAVLAVAGLAAAAQAAELTTEERLIVTMVDATDSRPRYSEAAGPVEVMGAQCRGKTVDAKVSATILTLSCAGADASQPAAWKLDLATKQLAEYGYLIAPDGAALISIKGSISNPATAAVTLDSIKQAMVGLVEKIVKRAVN